MPRFRRLAASTSLALALAAAPLFAQSPAADPILGALRIGSLDDLAATAGAFADNVKPGSGAATAQLTAGAAAFGLDGAGEILVLLLDPTTSPQPFAFVLPVADPEALKTNPMLGFKPIDPALGRHRITLGGRRMAAAFVGKRLVVTPLEAGLDAVLPFLESGEDIRGLRGLGGQLALSLSIDRLYSAYKSRLDGMLAGMREQSPPDSADSATPAVDAVEVFAALLGSVGELQTGVLRITIKPERIEIRSLVEAKPGTSAAALLNPGRGPAVTTLGLHDPASAVLGTISAKPGPEFWQAYNDHTIKLLAAVTPGDAQDAVAREMTRTVSNFAAFWDGTASFGMLSSDKGLSGGGIAGITDRTRALDWLRTIPDLQKQLSGSSAAQGLVSEAVIAPEETYGDARLLEITHTYQAVSPTNTAVLDSLKKLGLERLTTTYAVTSDRLLYAMGDDARASAKRLVDATAVTPAPVASTTPALYGLPDGTTLFAAVSLPRYLSWVARVADLPLQTANPAPDARPGLALTADLDAGRANLRLHLDASEIAALIRMFTPQPAATATGN